MSTWMLAVWRAGTVARVMVAAAMVAAGGAAGCGAGAPTDSAPDPGPDAVEAAAPEDRGLGEVVGTAPQGDAVVRAIVLLDPTDEIEVPLPDELPVMDQIGRQFVPGFILVRAGQTIKFINSDDDLHTIHVKDSSGESLFNVASMNGTSYQYTFELGDSFTVKCNTHSEMHADILVVDTPYAVVAERDGSFTVSDVVAGRYTATVILGTDRWERDVEIVAGRNQLDLTES